MIRLPIEHLDDRLSVYYDKCLSRSDLREDLPEIERTAFMAGWSHATFLIIRDLNEASMEAAFDSIVDKLK
jgi:hypothetical protein